MGPRAPNPRGGPLNAPPPAENRVSFGRTKAEKKLSQAEQDLAKSRLDSHKRDDNEKP